MSEIIPDRKYAKMAKVKNKAIAPVQITAEQLLREANERKDIIKSSKRVITDPEEIYEVNLSKRRQFEEAARRNRGHISTWIKYAMFELSIGEVERARSIFERAIDVDCRNITVWLRYAEMEMQLKNVNHTRNIWNRAITQLPRVDQFWYKYAYMEEMLGDVNAARQVYERWMTWEPAAEIWSSFIKFEKRYSEFDKARNIFERFIRVHPTSKAWLKYAKFEEELRQSDKARRVYERATDSLEDDEKEPKLFVQFAKFETRMKEFERARVIYKHALQLFPESRAQSLYNNYSQFEKQFGTKAGIEDAIIGKRRIQYEKEVEASPNNYDSWLNLIRLEEANNLDNARAVYERAVLQVPPANEKRFWRRYIYLWINYAIFEELIAKDFFKTEEIYKRIIKLIPHKQFTFAKVFRMYAGFLIRRLELSQFRKLMGMAIGMAPKPRIFKDYIEMEMQLREFDRSRKLYEKFLEFKFSMSSTWISYAELEKLLGDDDRCRGIFELAISQPLMDTPESIWKSYIEYEKCRNLYERLLSKTEHVKVWISYANFESSIQSISKSAQPTRAVFEKAYSSLKQQQLNQERVLLLEAWRDFEIANDDPAEIEKVNSKFPKQVKKKRKTEDGGFEEYLDFIFPDEQADLKPHLKLLEMAHKWKQEQS